MFETIVALATAPLKSALHIIRVSGDDCFDIVSKCFSKDIRDIKERTLLVGHILDGEKIVDEVVVAIYKGPKSFTGEDLVEIICHGSVLIANEIISLLLSKGARLATNGEYTSRAFLHERIDLVQAEAINDVINATTKEAKELSMLSLKGETSKLILPLKKRIADILSLIEVNIDYPEYEDIEVANKDNVVSIVDELVPQIDKLVSEGEKGLIIKEGIKVSLVGKPNVGKSSLLNALLGESKAIVTDIAGTTRDIVEGEINLNGVVLHLLDTAGIRDVDDKVESIGVNKSKDAIKESDLVIVLLDASNELDDQDKEILDLVKDVPHIIAYNKIDKASDNKLFKDAICISALNNDITPLKNAVYERLGLKDETFKTPSLNNTRQLGLLKNVKESLLNAKEDALNDLPIDLVSVSLHDAYNATLEILGEYNQTDISKEIFSRFCVGK
ncbi:MAG: tRNA uridine-5-carboxymethylaminomethyl(34) synthesis GTPase MnmE [Bacilli bacterium]|nr:tRNA uridine-5-carboxymethylaminomethyl(34) synthesis GTPase MnmE [Bacilli bacterium]